MPRFAPIALRACGRPLALGLLLAISQPALGSQYPLEQAAAIIPRAHVPRLRRAGIRSTADFLVWGRTPDGRRLLAERARIGIGQITGWVQLADLMRVAGIGPDVARLLTGVGVRRLADLQRADPVATAAAIRDFNKKTHLSTNPPGAESLRYWIGKSRELPLLVVWE